MNIVMTKAALITHLSERLKLAKAEDAAALKAHQEQEQVELRKFRDKLRGALKWDYKTAHNYVYSRTLCIDSPSCPRSQANPIDHELRSIKLDTRKGEQFTIVPKTDLYAAVTWLPASERTKRDMCE